MFGRPISAPSRRLAFVITLGVLLLPVSAPEILQTPSSPDPPSCAPASRDWWARVSARIAASEYEARPHGGVLQAPNRAQNLRTAFRPEGIEIRPREPGDPSWSYRWSSAAWGRPGTMRPCDASEPRARGARVEYARSGLTEWYENRPEGLEQGFTIDHTPAGSGPLTITARISTNAAARLDAGNSAIELVDSDGAILFRYGSIVVRDAHAVTLPWTLSMSDDLLAISVDDRDARYPIVIDPLFTTPSWRTEGDQAGAEFGFAVSTAGDVNGDGYSDVLVGAPNYDNGQVEEGRAYLYQGSSTGPAMAPSWTGEPNQSGAQYGYCVAAAGDVNGDKYADVLVGARFLDAGQADEGLALLYPGSASGLAGSPSWNAQSNQAGAQMGFSVAGAGDVNGDGYDDVIVGAPYLDTGAADAGGVFVYHGSPTGPSTTPSWIDGGAQAGAQLGYAVSSAGDANADGYADVLFSAPLFDNGNTDEGRALIHLGSPGGVLPSPVWHAEGDQDFASFGEALGTAGDLNGDGYGDVVIGAYLYDNGEIDEGRATTFYGDSMGIMPGWSRSVESDQAGALFGASVGTAGDINGDGCADLIVGASHYDGAFGNAGRCYVYLGGTNLWSGLTPVWTEDGEHADAQFGFAAATAGDIDDDGFSDVLVGAHFYGSGQALEGGAYIYRGASGGLSPALTPFPGYGSSPYERFGMCVGAAGDVNGDGHADAIIGAPSYDGGMPDQGRAYVFLGVHYGLAYYPVWTAEGDRADASFGSGVSCAGDVDADGYSDILVGASTYESGEALEGAAYLYRGSSGGPETTWEWMEEGGVAAGSFGARLAMAGDVNGDGYGDFLVAAPWADLGEVDEGRVVLYYGSSSGPTQAWESEGDQTGAQYGYSVGAAGDVNADGYGDVVIGAPEFTNGETNEGQTFVYLGSASGLASTADWTAGIDQADAAFGTSVATAGDVNGDHYSDVVIGASEYDRGEVDEGGAFLYLGSVTGLAAAPVWVGQSNQAGAQYGFSVASAGDVNGDGRSDIVVGARNYDNPEPNEGRAFAYLGAPSGVETVAHWTAEGDQDDARFGTSLAGAGDTNGDGFADVIVGAPNYTLTETNQGRVFLFSGNSEGLDRSAQQRQADDTRPISLLAWSQSEHSFLLQADGRTPAGRGKIRLQWEVKPFGTPFDRTGLGQGSLLDTGAPVVGSAVTIAQLVEGLAPATRYTWRVRTRSSSPFFPGSPWITLGWNDATEVDFRTGNATTAADEVLTPGARLIVWPSRPNPASGASTISYRLTEPSRVQVGIYDVGGRRVRSFEPREVETGVHTLSWDARDDHGAAVAAGVYFVRFAGGGTAVTRRVEIVR